MGPIVPVTIIAGALGAGKTTLVNRIARELEGRRLAIVQNEFGEVPVEREASPGGNDDPSTVATTSWPAVIEADEEIFEVRDGGQPVTVRGDLIRVLGRLLQRRERPDRILVETTGPADLAPIARTFTLDADVKRSFRLDGIVTLVDARLLTTYVEGTTGAHEQIASADVLVVNKIDMVSVSELAAMERWLRGVNGMARIRRARYADVRLEQVLDVRRAGPEAGSRPRPPTPVSSVIPRRTTPRALPNTDLRPALWRADLGDFPRAAQWAASGDEVAIGTATGNVEVRRGRDGTLLFRRQLHEGAVTALAWHPRAHRLAIAGEDGAIRILDLDSSGTTALTGTGGRGVELLAWSPDGTALAIARGHAVAISAGDARPLSYLPAVESTIAGLAWSPDGALIACACYGGVRLFDPKTRRSVRRLDAAGSMLSLAWSPDGNVIACGCQDNRVCTWRLPNGEDTSMAGYASKPKALSFSADGRLLATAGGHDASVWNIGGDAAESRTPIRLVGHASPITALAFAPVRALLATACRDGHLHLWEPGEHGRPVAFLRMEHRVENLAWGSTGSHRDILLAATDAGGSLAVWAVT